MKNILIAFVGLLFVSVAFGVGLNAMRNEPLSLIYQRPSQRISSGTELAGATAPGDWNTGVNIIDLKVAAQIVGAGSTIILDARSDLFFEFGHIPGAENLAQKNFEVDYARLEETLALAIEEGRPVLVYCSNPHCEDAGKVARKLIERGFPIILLFEGGFKQWEDAGMEIVKGK